MKKIEFYSFEKVIADRMQSECEKYPDPSHDFLHVKRVVSQATKLAVAENADLNIVLPATYLHDVVVISKTDERRKRASQISADEAVIFLKSIGYPEKYLDGIHHAICAHSFSAGIAAETIEAKVVQDADRLDAIGAIGIARCFALSGIFKSTFYCDGEVIAAQRPLDDKKFVVDHFFFKLLKVADQLHTSAGKEQGKIRKIYLQNFITQLQNELGHA